MLQLSTARTDNFFRCLAQIPTDNGKERQRHAIIIRHQTDGRQHFQNFIQLTALTKLITYLVLQRMDYLTTHAHQPRRVQVQLADSAARLTLQIFGAGIFVYVHPPAMLRITEQTDFSGNLQRIEDIVCNFTPTLGHIAAAVTLLDRKSVV